MNLLKKALLAFVVIITYTKTIAQSADPLTYIPKQAQNVYVINLPTILPKMDFQTLKDLSFVKEVLEKGSNQQAMAYLKNPMEMGVNLFKPMAITITPIEGTPHQVVATIIPLLNQDKFNAIIASGNSKIVQKDGLSVVEGDTSVLAWNNLMFVAMKLVTKKDPMSALMAKSDTSDTQEKLPTLDPSVYFQNSETNIKTDALRALMGTPHDIYIYQATNGAGKSMKGMIASMAFGLNPTDLDGNVTTGWADFENGRIYGESTQKMNEAMAQKFSSIGKAQPTVDWNDYINTSSGQKPTMVVSFSLNPMGIKDLINSNPMLQMGAEKAATKASDKFSMNKVFNTFGGDVFAAMTKKENGMDFLIGLSIANKKAAEKMIKEDLKLKKMGKNLYVFEPKKPVVTEDMDTTSSPMTFMKAKSPMFVLLKDNVALIGKEAQIQALSKAKLTKLAANDLSDWQKSLKNKPLNVYIDVQSISGMAKGKLDNMPFESVSLNMSHKVTSFEVKMLEKDKNALTAFFIFVDKTMQDKKAKEKQTELQDGIIKPKEEKND